MSINQGRTSKSKYEMEMGLLTRGYSAKDMPGHTKIKYRQEGQGSEGEVGSRDFRRELDSRERSSGSSRERPSITASASSRSRSERSEKSGEKQTASESGGVQTFAIDADEPLDSDSDEEEDELSRKKRAAAQARPQALAGFGAGAEEPEEEEAQAEEDDDEAELRAELERIRRERAAETERRDAQRREEEERVRRQEMLADNPLLKLVPGSAPSFTVKRRWDDDTVFKNCARGVDLDGKRRRAANNTGPEFINDTLRSEFHHRFMDKYIK